MATPPPPSEADAPDQAFLITVDGSRLKYLLSASQCVGRIAKAICFDACSEGVRAAVRTGIAGICLGLTIVRRRQLRLRALTKSCHAYMQFDFKPSSLCCQAMVCKSVD